MNKEIVGATVRIPDTRSPPPLFW